MISLGLRVLGRKTIEINCHKNHILPSVLMINIFVPVNVDFDQLAEVVCIVCVKILYCKVTLFSSFHTAVLEMKSLLQPIHKEWEALLSVLEGEVSMCIIWNCTAQEICVLLHLFI